MRRIVLLGAGQMGQAALGLLNRANYEVIAFGDNAPKAQGTLLEGIPILSVEQAVQLAPDVILIAVAGSERTTQLMEQLDRLNYAGEVETLDHLSGGLDIRAGVLARLAPRLAPLPGAAAELGVYRGDFARVINRLMPGRILYLFDTFEGFDPRDIGVEQEGGYSRARTGDFSDTDPTSILSRMTAPEQVVIRKGYFPETARGLEETFAFVSLDADLYEPTLNGLNWFYPRTLPGGVILIHDYHNPRFSGVRAAVDAYEREHGPLLLLPVGDLHGSVMLLHP